MINPARLSIEYSGAKVLAITEGTFNSKLSLASGARRRIERMCPRNSLRNSSMSAFWTSVGLTITLPPERLVMGVYLR